jgi:drug/metabolite transporter (DMT)-like permease
VTGGGRVPSPVVTNPSAAATVVVRSRGRHHVSGLAIVALAALIWSTGGLIVRSLERSDTWTTIFYRSLFASIFLVGFVVVRDRRSAVRSFTSMGRASLLVGACFATASISLVVALGMTSVANTLVIISAAPLLAAVIGRVVLAEAVKPRTWVAAAVTVVGVVIMVSGSSAESSLRGDAVAMLIPVALATATVTIRQHHEVLMIPAMAVGTMIALVVSVPLVGTFAVTRHDLGLLAIFGAVQLGLGLALFAVGARRAPPAEVALMTLLEPVLGPIWVWLLLDEYPGAAVFVGGSLVLGAMAVHTTLDLRRRTVPLAA